MSRLDSVRLLLLVALALAARPGAAQDGLLAERAAFDAELRDPNTSLLDPRIQRVFDGVPYFPVDPAYRVEAAFTPTPDARPFAMPTSAGTEQRYAEAGTLRFDLGGEPLVLHAYRPVPASVDSLFVPFRDATSGTESYGGGRYLYVPLPVGETVVLDFNTVTSPYCAYSAAYACPLPPEENTLAVPIRAGEKAPPASWLDALLAPVPAEWPLVTSPFGRFQIAFPYPPRTVAHASETAPELEVLTLDVDTLSLAAVVQTAPVAVSAAQQAAFLDRAISRMAERGRIVRREAASLDGRPATRLVLETAFGRLDALLAMTDRQLVTLTASPSLADRFFRSARWVPETDGP